MSSLGSGHCHGQVVAHVVWLELVNMPLVHSQPAFSVSGEMFPKNYISQVPLTPYKLYFPDSLESI